MPAARERIRLMRAAAQSPKVCQQVLLHAALRVTEVLDDSELPQFIRALQDVLPLRFAKHIEALCHAESGFSGFRAGRFGRAARGLMRAFRGAPQLIGNMGAWSVIGRAMLASIGVERQCNVVQMALQQLDDALGMTPLGVSDTGSGTNANTFVVRMPHGRVLLRVLRSADALTHAESLAHLMKQLRAAEVRVPEVIAYGGLEQAPGETPAAWVAEEFVLADVSEPWRIRRGDAVQLAFELGNQLRRAHELPAPAFGTGKQNTFADWLDAELPYNPEAESRLTHDIRVRLMHARDLLLSSHPIAPVVLHADLWPGNYLVTLDGEVVLIDWASSRGGDAAFDPAIWYMALRDHDLLDKLLASYSPPNPTLFRQRVNAYADLYAASLMSERFSNQRIDTARLHAQARRWLDRSHSKQLHHVTLPKDVVEKQTNSA
jgi:fructosamine-3-kinase